MKHVTRQLTRQLILVLLTLFVMAPLLPAQPRSQLKRQLRAMIAQAKNDTTLLFEAANFAKDHNFTADYKRLIKKILRIDKDHAGANAAEGRVKYEGKWISQADYKKKLAAKQEAEFKAAGKVKVNGVWVDKDKVAEAKRGVFHHDGRLVNKWEMQQFQSGKVRHPRTGRFIDEGDLEKAKKEDLVPLPDGRWVSVKAADRFHSDKSHPWVIRSRYSFLTSTMPLAELEAMASVVDVGASTVLKIFGGGDPPPARIPTIHMARTTEDYKEIGARIGTGDDVFGVYITSNERGDAARELEGNQSRLVVMNYGEPTWRKFFARHAAGLAMCCSFLGEDLDKAPAWFSRGVASHASRFLNESQAKYFAKQHKAQGGVSDLRDWFDDFKISIDISHEAVQANIFQAGLLVTFCLKGGDKKATDALLAVTQACKGGGKVIPAIERLQKVLTSRQSQVRAYFETLTK